MKAAGRTSVEIRMIRSILMYFYNNKKIRCHFVAFYVWKLKLTLEFLL